MPDGTGRFVSFCGFAGSVPTDAAERNRSVALRVVSVDSMEVLSPRPPGMRFSGCATPFGGVASDS